MDIFLRAAVGVGAAVGFSVNAGVRSYVGALLGAFMGVAIILSDGNRGWGAGNGEQCCAG